MQFNSWAFVLAFTAFYPLYRLTARWLTIQNALLLGASYGFYAWWDWRFTSLLLLSTCVDFFVSHQMRTTDQDRRKLYLAISVATNLGILIAFKYLDFFVASTETLLGALGLHVSAPLLHLTLPLGISFYTFQTMGYTIDVYRRRQEPAQSFADFALYVAFFPQLVAGPIERARNLLPQIQKVRQVSPERVSSGLFLIVWGYTQKLVIADNAGAAADYAFYYYRSLHGIDLVLGVLLFGIQIFADFSAYSDIARGLAKLLGFELMVNFRLPYMATSPRELWQRWHISLSTWLRDYLYVPLGGSRGSRGDTYRNLFITMLLGGLWHGARWNFVLWGAWHGLLLVAQRALPGAWTRFPGARIAGWVITFGCVQLGWLLFRSESLDQVVHFLTEAGATPSATTPLLASRFALTGLPLALVHGLQWRSRNLLFAARWPVLAQGALLALMLATMAVFAERASVEFIYFQF